MANVLVVHRLDGVEVLHLHTGNDYPPPDSLRPVRPVQYKRRLSCYQPVQYSSRPC